MGKTGSCSDWQGLAQQRFNPIFLWWVGLHSLPGSCLARGDLALRSMGCMVRLMVTSKKVYANRELPRELLLVPCPCGELLQTHTSTGDPFTLADSFASVSCGVSALFLWVLVHTVLFVPFKTGASVSPSPAEVLKSNPNGLQGQIPWGLPVSLSGPQVGEPDMGFWTFTTVGELLWHYCSLVCGLHTLQLWDLTLLWLCPYCLAVASSLSLDVEYLFMVGSSPAADDCSTACDFGTLMEGHEHMSIDSPSWTGSGEYVYNGSFEYSYLWSFYSKQLSTFLSCVSFNSLFILNPLLFGCLENFAPSVIYLTIYKMMKSAKFMYSDLAVFSFMVISTDEVSIYSEVRTSKIFYRISIICFSNLDLQSTYNRL